MKSYDLTKQWGTHEIEVTFQYEEYKGTVRYKMGGNAKGFSLLEGAHDRIMDEIFTENNSEFKMLDDEWFSMVLRDEKGDKLLIEDEVTWLGEKITGVRIVGFKEDVK